MMAGIGTTLESLAMRTPAIVGPIAHRQMKYAAARTDEALTFEGD